MKRAAIIILAVLAILVAIRLLAFPYQDLRYRLTLTLNTDGKDHSGSTVTHVSYEHPIRTLPPSGRGAVVEGEALLVDLGARGVVAALLKGADTQSAGEYTATPAAIPVREFGIAPSLGSVEQKDVARIRRNGAKASIPSDRLPLLVYFRDIKDPTSARLVDPNDLKATIGDEAKLVHASVETVSMGPWPLYLFLPTGVPVSTGIEKRIPWLSDRQTRKAFLQALHKSGYKRTESVSIKRWFVRE